MLKQTKRGLKGLAEDYMFYREAERTFFKTEEFPWVTDVEAEWQAIRKELDVLMLNRERITNFQDYSPPAEGHFQ